MQKKDLYTLLRKFWLLGIGVIICAMAYSQSRTIRFLSSDKIWVTADLYEPNASTKPMIILFHQAGYSRGEYIEIAPKLTAMGFNCLAVDLRSGDEVNGVENMTHKMADSLHMQTRYTDSYTDMQAALSYVKRTFPKSKIILFGSSYSASLAIKLASDFPERVAGVVAFSPGEYFFKFGWKSNIIQISASRIKCPVFITSASSEQDTWKKIYDAIPVKSKVSFIPSTETGKHGAKTLWKVFPESTEYWNALKGFLRRYQ